jgi:hypothetical protein
VKDFVHSLLEKSRWPVLVLLLAGIVTLLAYYQPSKASLTEVQFDRTDPPAYGLLVLAAVLLATGAFLLIRSPSSPGRYRARVDADGDDISTCIGQCRIAITYGRLEEASAEHREAVLVVLPANEYFDDECINDSHSALGAFVQGRLRDAQADFQSGLDAELRTVPSEPADADGRRRYPLGTGVYLKGHACADGGHLLVAAATEQLPEGGLRGDLKALFTICRQAYRTARNARLDHVMMPLIGAGHGSIGPARALLGLLLAWCEIFYRASGYRMTVTIVIFKADDVEPAVGRDDAKELLSIAAGVTSPVR